MKKYHLPIPSYEIFSSEQEAIRYINKIPEQTLFIKASGLAGGKGVIKAATKQEAITAIRVMKQFKKAGETFVIEEELKGEEFSLFALCDGEHYKVIGSAQDHKTVYNKNTGPNTGGMGCISNPTIITPKIQKDIEEKILIPFMNGMQKEERPYTGILYLGGMLTKTGPKIIEFNARWGDPEAEVLIPSIKNDYVDIINAVLKNELATLHIKLDNKKRVSVCGVLSGYPGDYTNVVGKEIFGLDTAAKVPGVTIYGAGIKKKGKRFLANGGRLFHIVAEGKDIFIARRLAYQAMSMIYIEDNNLHYRTDIGWQEMARVSKNV
jgi:phosphoribosylamine--glycine ligase